MEGEGVGEEEPIGDGRRMGGTGAGGGWLYREVKGSQASARASGDIDMTGVIM